MSCHVVVPCNGGCPRSLGLGLSMETPRGDGNIPNDGEMSDRLPVGGDPDMRRRGDNGGSMDPDVVVDVIAAVPVPVPAAAPVPVVVVEAALFR